MGAYQPDALSDMLQRYEATGAKYNEVVVATRHWALELPAVMEAPFYMGGSSCLTGTCEEVEGCPKARAMHAAFLAQYGKTSEEVPLLCLDDTDWRAPFKDVSSLHAPPSGA